MRTLQFSHVHPKLVALFQDALAPFFDEVIKSRGEACHAIAKVFETEVDAGKGIGY